MPLEIFSETLTPSAAVQRVATDLADPILEGTTATYVLEPKVAGGGTLDSSDISAATLTLYDEETKSVINSRKDQDIRGTGTGANNVVITLASKFTWSMQPADNIMVDPTNTKRIEYHRAIFTIEYDSGDGPEKFIHDIRFPVKKAFLPE